MWVDTHCHLQLADEEPEELLRRAAGVDWLVVPGIDAETSRAAIDLAGRHERLTATAGLHPHHADAWVDQGPVIEELAGSVSAVGETGLDFYRDLAPRHEQRRAFEAQISLAIEHGLPLVVHCRDAFADVYQILERHEAGPRAVMHCWTGGSRWTRRFLGLGVTFSFAGPIAFETGDTIRHAASVVPPERALVETDTPYLAPPPHRGRPNEPANVALVGAALAEVWAMPVEDVAEITSRNATRVFGR